MESLRSLPTPAKVALPLGALLAIALVAYFTMFASPGWTDVTSSPDADQIAAAQWKLEGANLKSKVVRDGNVYRLQVNDENKAAAQETLEGSDFGSRIGMSKQKKCTEPGQFGGNRAHEAYTNCKAQEDISMQLRATAGVLNANVKVVTEDSGSLTGESELSRVTVQLFLDPNAERPDGRMLASRIANLVPGGSMDRVFISDSEGTTLWSKDSGVTSGGGNASCVGGSEPITDITAKEQAVKTCLEQDLAEDIGQLVGGNDRVSATVAVRLSPEAQTKNTREVTKAVLLEQNRIANTGGGNKSVNETKNFTPNTAETQTTRNAGYIQRMSIAVALDSRYVTPAQESAVRKKLEAYRDVQRGDPMPSVMSTAFAGGATEGGKKKGGAAGANGAPDAEAGAGAGGSGGSGDDGVLSTEAGKDIAATVEDGSSGIPRPVLVVAFLLLVVMATVIALLWRRGSRLQAEKARFAQEFQRDQRLFQDFAATHPDELARELEDLFGQPAREPVAR